MKAPRITAPVMLVLLALAPLRLSEARAAAPEQAPPQAAATRLQVTGRVVDEQGKPVADALVRAQSSPMGPMIWWAFKPETRTDADGAFSLDLPFREILYAVQAEKMGYAGASVAFVGGELVFVELTLKPVREPAAITGTLSDPAGKPVAGATVELIAEYGLRASARTDGAGLFVLSPLSGYVGEAVPLARVEGLVAPLQIVHAGAHVELVLGPPAALKGVVRDQDDGRPVAGATVIIRPWGERVELILGPPAGLRGTVRDEDNENPVAGGTVIMRPWFASDFRMEAATAEDGTFSISGIPPGEYTVTATTPTHFRVPPRGFDSELPRVNLAPGETRSMDIEMQRCATVSGRVEDPEGRPVPAALVCIESTWLGDYRDQPMCVDTDENGRFSITTGRIGEKLPLHAYSASYGLASVDVGPLKAGQVVEDVALRLMGSVRLRGVVTDPQGQPLKDVLCLIERIYTVSDLTDAEGRFDLGQVSLTQHDRPPYSVTFRAPRPQHGGGFAYSFEPRPVTLDTRAEAPEFLQHRVVPYDPKPGKEVTLNVALEPADLLQITGTVVDDKGQPIPGAKVHLFTGDAKSETWLETLHPPVATDYIAIRLYDTVLDRVQTDAQGRWAFWTVRETGEGTPMGGRNTDWTSYCIGVEAPDGRSRLVRDIVVPHGEFRRELTIEMPAAAAAPAALAPAQE